MTIASEGRFNLSQSGNILTVEAHGPFDAASVTHFLHDIKEVVSDIKQTPWATLAVYSGHGVFSFDAEEILIETTKERMKNNMVAIAAVISNTSQTDLLQMQLNRVYQSCNLKHNFFSDHNCAQAWLARLLESKHNVR